MTKEERKEFEILRQRVYELERAVQSLQNNPTKGNAYCFEDRNNEFAKCVNILKGISKGDAKHSIQSILAMIEADELTFKQKKMGYAVIGAYKRTNNIQNLDIQNVVS